MISNFSTAIHNITPGRLIVIIELETAITALTALTPFISGHNPNYSDYFIGGSGGITPNILRSL
jgi:hypothetical protein